jgi:hypothetical protein
MEGSIRAGIVFDIKEMIVRDSTVAVRVGLVKGGELLHEVHQFLFSFNNGKIIRVKESTDNTPLSEMFD